jgi:hypothetical protein
MTTGKQPKPTPISGKIVEILQWIKDHPWISLGILGIVILLILLILRLLGLL